MTDTSTANEYWIEPGTREAYPVAYGAYRRKREAQEKRPARHRQLGSDIDYDLWRRWLTTGADADIVLAVRPGTSPRVQRLVTQVLWGIRRGRPANEAIRHVARRFGLRRGRACAFITTGILVERQSS